jgi:RNase H-like domain found in reverse transcriptase
MGSDRKGSLYAIIWSLNKFRTWIFGSPITIFADSNPLTHLTASVPKSAKLTCWILALQEFDIVFKYTKGHDHVAPDVQPDLDIMECSQS